VIFSVFDRLRPRLPGYPAMVTQKGMDETGGAEVRPFGAPFRAQISDIRHQISDRPIWLMENHAL